MIGNKGWRDLKKARQKQSSRDIWIDTIAAVIAFATFIAFAILTFPMDPY